MKRVIVRLEDGVAEGLEDFALRHGVTITGLLVAMAEQVSDWNAPVIDRARQIDRERRKRAPQ